VNIIVTGKPATIEIELYDRNADGTVTALTGTPEVTGALVGIGTQEGLISGLTFTKGSDLKWSAAISAAAISAGLLEFDDSSAAFVEDITARGRVLLQVHIGAPYNRGHKEFVEVYRGQI
jgi:hypothetical protein